MLLKSQKDLSIYVLLEKQANLATRSAEKFLEMVDNFEAIDAYAEALSDLEHACESAIALL